MDAVHIENLHRTATMQISCEAKLVVWQQGYTDCLMIPETLPLQSSLKKEQL